MDKAKKQICSFVDLRAQWSLTFSNERRLGQPSLNIAEITTIIITIIINSSGNCHFEFPAGEKEAISHSLICSHIFFYAGRQLFHGGCELRSSLTTLLH